MRFLYTFLPELCCASIPKHETDDKCYDQLGCNNDCYNEFVVTTVTMMLVITAIITNLVITAVTTKLVGCYNQVDRNIYHLFHVCKYWHNKVQQ